ncbi:MAG: TonB-dependent receptor domain-containing protein [Terriglobia bacterium]
MKTKNFPIGLLLLALLAGLGFGPPRGAAQDLRATINGTITDPSGAPVPGAQVQVTDAERGMQFHFISNRAGRYSSGPLLPGRYNLSVQATGFRKYVRTGILLHLSEQAGVNVSLQLGAVTQTVSISSRAPLLDTETADRGAIIPPQLIDTLPNNGRDVFNLVFAMPGAYQPCTCEGQGVSITGVGHATFGINGSAGGASGRTPNNGILLNGVSDQNGGNSATLQPGLYSVDEVQVKTSTYDAQYGRTGGGYVAMTTKAGTNTLHGIAFENLNNSALAANSWANNLHGKPKPSSIVSNYGFEVGGPVFIPKVYNGKDKLFFMVSWDRTPARSASGETGTVPTIAERSGDFSGLTNAQGQVVTIYDPTTTAPGASGGYTRSAFAGNIIPSGRINALGQKVLNLYPSPSGPGIGLAHTNNLFVLGPTSDVVNQWIERGDYRLSDRNRFYAQFGRTTETIYNYGLFADVPLIASGTSAPGENNSMQGVVDWTSTLTPTTIWDLRAGFTRLEQNRNNSFSAGFNPATLGFPASLVSQFYQLQFPEFVMGQFAQLGANGSINNDSEDQDVDVQASVAKAAGKHFIHAGAGFINYGTALVSPGNASGAYSFTRQWTQRNPLVSDSISGNEAADLLLGLPSSGDVDRNPNPYYTSKDWALYVQDNWKVNPRLSLNLGLRWDYETPLAERHNRITRGFAFGQASPLAAAVASAPGAANCPACAHLQGGLLFAGSSGTGRYAWNPDYSAFQPRLGAAFRLDQHTVLRGGFGMYRLLTAMNEDGSLTTGFNVQTPLIASLDGGLTPAVSLANPFPGGLITPPGSSLGLATLLGTSVPFASTNFPAPPSYQWSFGLERSLPAQIVVDASYIGNKTTGYPLNASLDFIPTSQLGQPVSHYTAKVTNPFAGLLPANSSLNGATIPLEDLQVAYPQFSGVTEMNVPIGWSRYDSLQVSGTRRFASGAFVMVNYTISKALMRQTLVNPQGFSLADPAESNIEETLTPFDIPQKLDLLGTYNLPFGHGERFAASVPTIVNGAIGGWRLGWNVTLQSGFPVPYPNAAAIKPGSANLSGSQQNILQWFNTSLFPNVAGPAPFTLQTFPTMFPNVRYMGFDDWDFSLMKDFPIYERLKFRIRADFINAFNRPFFTQMQSLDVSNPQFGQLKQSQNNNPRSVLMEADIIF